MCQHTDPSEPALLWNRLAGLRGTATACTCSDMQLVHVGCECDAKQNLPVSCEECGTFCRTEEEILTLTCNSCRKAEAGISRPIAHAPADPILH